MNSVSSPLDFILVHGYILTPEGHLRPLLRQRLEDGLSLYRSGAAQHIIVAGRCGPEDRAFVERTNITQADLMADYLVKQGIPPQSILREKKGTTTWDCTKRVLEDILPAHAYLRGGYIVSNREHLPRISLQTGKLLSMLGEKLPPLDIRYAGSPMPDTEERTAFLMHESRALRETLSRAD